ncbi:TetR family transcriptional regulator [Dactylosporangium sp. NPDC005555]|uniref:TetR/AcrR family transcriptional regulator n=1 Tax=Dactylosporangium sp. NPDC005555 TaxID=3154889 RepID=UPI0033A0243C
MAAPATSEPGESTAKGEQTRRLIVDTAVRLFGEQGYDKTTMRAIAAAAGVSVGNAYYYFPSKNHLVQAFYTTVQDAHDEACRHALATPGPFVDRLRAALLTGVEAMAPYHGFAGSFFKTAAEPGSPVSPFSADSAPTRERSVRMFRSVVDGATTKIDPELRAELPELLWLAQMGITLYWVHDTSPGQTKTRLLVERSTPLIDRLVGMSRFRVFQPVVREALSLYRLLR